MIFGIKKVHPKHDMILVRRLEFPKMAALGSRLYAPVDKEVRHESHLAVVVEVGPGREGVPDGIPDVVPGEYVLLSRMIGERIELDGQIHNVVKWGDVLGSVEFTEEGLKFLDEATKPMTSSDLNLTSDDSDSE